MAETNYAVERLKKPCIRILKSILCSGIPGTRRYAVFMPPDQYLFIIDTNRMTILRDAIEWNASHPKGEWVQGVYYG
jgi:hypothetical protein